MLNQLAYNWRILIYIKDEFEFSKKEHDWPLRSKDNMLVENSIPPCEILMFFESWLLQCDPALCNYRSTCVEKLAFYQTAPAESSRMLPCEVCKTWRILFLSKSMGTAKKNASVKCIDPAINKNPNKSTIKVITSSQKPKTNEPAGSDIRQFWVLYIFSVYRFKWNKVSSRSLNKQLCWICFKTTLDQQIKMAISQTISFCGL